MRQFAKIGYMIGGACAIFLLFMLAISENEDWHAYGPANPGHAALGCTDCHTPADGSIIQQVRDNAGAFLGLRDESVTFGFEDVTNEDCEACHERPNNRHPVLKFSEAGTGYDEARAAIAPQFCESCHQEHQGKRVTIDDPTYCRYCHQFTSLSDDPIEVPHADLIADEQWETCLQCHDFHGNHIRETPTTSAEMISLAALKAYFEDGLSPYGNERFDSPKEALGD